MKKKAAKEKPLDIGYDINFEVHSKKNSSISHIAHIKITSEFDTKGKDFETINAYLTLLSQVYNRSEKAVPIYEVYTLLNELHKVDIKPEKILLAQLKLRHIF